jgi:hypothetical protein
MEQALAGLPKIGNRVSSTLAVVVLAGGLAGCGWFEDDTPTPARVQAPPADDQRGYPNLGTVPDRPQTSTAADRAALAGQLASDRARARYSDDTRAIDETRGSTIGSLVRPKPPEPKEPAREKPATEPATPADDKPPR